MEVWDKILVEISNANIARQPKGSPWRRGLVWSSECGMGLMIRSLNCLSAPAALSPSASTRVPAPTPSLVPWNTVRREQVGDLLSNTSREHWVWRRKQNRLYLESRTPSWARLWTLSSMPSIYGNDKPTGKPGLRKEELQGAPSLKEHPNYLCNWIESYILLCLLGHDHKPIDNCPLLTT